MDRFGGPPDGAQRYANILYLACRIERDLRPIRGCAVKEPRSASYYICFVADYNKDGRIHMRIKSLAKRSTNPTRANWPD